MKYSKEKQAKVVKDALSKGWDDKPVSKSEITYRAQILPRRQEPMHPALEELTQEDMELLISKFRGM